MLPFTKDVLLRLLAHYNAAVWPAQAIAAALGVVVVFLVFRPRKGSDGFIAAVLAGAWIWTGAVYHVMYLTTINWAAWASGTLFVCQGCLIAWAGMLRGKIAFRVGPGRVSRVGLGMMVLAVFVYPLAGPLTDLGWRQAPVAGIASGPTVLLTLGLMLLAAGRIPILLLLIPLLWSIVAGAAAWLLRLPYELIQPGAAAAAVWLALARNRRLAREPKDPP